jgi:hypothetical protein
MHHAGGRDQPRPGDPAARIVPDPLARGAVRFKIPT